MQGEPPDWQDFVDPSGDDDGLNLSLLDGGAGEDFIARVFGCWQGLAGECGLIDLEGISFQETSISWDYVS